MHPKSTESDSCAPVKPDWKLYYKCAEGRAAHFMRSAQHIYIYTYFAQIKWVATCWSYVPRLFHAKLYIMTHRLLIKLKVN